MLKKQPKNTYTPRMNIIVQRTNKQYEEVVIRAGFKVK